MRRLKQKSRIDLTEDKMVTVTICHGHERKKQDSLFIMNSDSCVSQITQPSHSFGPIPDQKTSDYKAACRYQRNANQFITCTLALCLYAIVYFLHITLKPNRANGELCNSQKQGCPWPIQTTQQTIGSAADL